MKKLIYNLPAKVAAFFLLVITAWVTVGCTAAAITMFELEVYTKSEDALRYEIMCNVAKSDASEVFSNYLAKNESYYEHTAKNSRFEIFKDGKKVTGNCDNPESYQIDWIYETRIDTADEQSSESCDIRMYINSALSVNDEYAFALNMVHAGYSLRYGIYAIAFFAIVAAIVCFIFLMCSAGHKNGSDAISVNITGKIPFDLLTAVLAISFTAGFDFILDYSNFSGVINAAFMVILFTLMIIIGVFYCMGLAVQIKLGILWRNTVIYRVWVIFTKIIKAIWSGVCILFKNIPLIWKTLFVYVLFAFAAFVAIFFDDTHSRFTVWLIINIILFPCVCYAVIMLQKFLKGSKALSGGDLSYKIDGKGMVMDFKNAAENLNSIAVGMSSAVERQMKSERFKTELITNVSHDIKTPLTTIINYTELLSREQTDNEKIAEYTAELSVQAERLKKLITDLVEASKASSGTLDVQLSPCEIGVLLTQTAGEYEQKFTEHNLVLITKQPEQPLNIMADGRLLWRVLDNLMNNACKYSQKGTRVYLTLEKDGSYAVISVKNISGYELDIPADELMERFVRGDSSRSTEGSGLGLSIAKSLVELQKGEFSIIIDGDLFKTVIKFPTI